MQTQLVAIDWIVVAGYCAVALGIGAYFSRRASRNIEEFFVAGRNLPWWVAGTSIVATTLAVDTPLFVAGAVRSGGIYKNWLWWNILMGGMLCVFFYAHLWRRSGVLTDVEFIELRYAGRPASILRGGLAVYQGVVYNCVTMGWVMLAMTKVTEVMLGWGRLETLAVLIAIALVYTTLSGFWGVVMTDLVQFVLAMTGAIALAGIVVWRVGGPGALVEKVRAAPGAPEGVLDMVPDLGQAGELAVITFAIQISMQWWAKGQGDGYIAQRLFATRDERQSVLAALWFNFAHYVLRPWPWILVGLASIVLMPITPGEDAELAYPRMIAEYMPAGLRGVMVASLLAAFMSTMDTQLNWGASYLVNDLYRRFIRRGASDRHYVWASRAAVLILSAAAALTAWQMETIEQAWKYLFVLTSGVAVVMLLRWYWWRVNAWSEISALAGSFLLGNLALWVRLATWLGAPEPEPGSPLALYLSPEYFAVRLAVVMTSVTLLWVCVTVVTRPAPFAKLEAFYRKVRPGGWWGPVAKASPEVDTSRDGKPWLGWLAGVACVYAGLFGIGQFCLARPLWGAAWLTAAAATGWLTLRQVPKDRPADR